MSDTSGLCRVKASILPNDLVTRYEVKVEVGNASEIILLLLYSL